MSNLYQLSYISKSSIDGDRNILETHIKSILDSATDNNLKLGITGALLYSGGYFCQVIEGEEENIEDLFESIQLDDRHTQVTVLNFEKAEERDFSEWSMAFAGIEDSMRFDITGIKDVKDEIVKKQTGQDIVSVLTELVKKKQATEAP
ncbi:BLUF domain-containing protein [Psychromonas sp. KJ10-10]|uniref:BLUF domain-containing protein n=1 Tax=Psychromonas sp. KJ10-10 TaxID=3391823 RepID=UPI0039B3D368